MTHCERCGAQMTGGTAPRCPNEHVYPMSHPVAVAAAPIETLRDRFAMAALTGLMSERAIASSMAADAHARAYWTEAAYDVADAMLAARQLARALIEAADVAEEP